MNFTRDFTPREISFLLLDYIIQLDGMSGV